MARTNDVDIQVEPELIPLGRKNLFYSQQDYLFKTLGEGDMPARIKEMNRFRKEKAKKEKKTPVNPVYLFNKTSPVGLVVDSQE